MQATGEGGQHRRFAVAGAAWAFLLPASSAAFAGSARRNPRRQVRQRRRENDGESLTRLRLPAAPFCLWDRRSGGSPTAASIFCDGGATSR